MLLCEVYAGGPSKYSDLLHSLHILLAVLAEVTPMEGCVKMHKILVQILGPVYGIFLPELL